MMIKKSQPLVFVIQKHETVRLHYDFRIEVGGVMPSWAIPKGPTLDPTVKRLAMQTPDHELSYRNFEGAIEEGSYGAGKVTIWDNGTYIPEVEIKKGERLEIADREEGEKVIKEGLLKGEIKFQLHGHKMKGSFALIKTHGFGPKNSWLLIKHKDTHDEAGYMASDH